jgi:hypothetical protein
MQNIDPRPNVPSKNKKNEIKQGSKLPFEIRIIQHQKKTPFDLKKCETKFSCRSPRCWF